MRAALVALLCAGCGARPASAPERDPACVAEETSILEAMSASAAGAACTSVDDCAVVTGPRHPSSEYGQVVAAGDAEELEARAIDHIERCGASAYHVAIDAYRVIEPACEASRCAAVETTYHVD